MPPSLLILVYGVTVVASAMAGGYLPTLLRMNHVRMHMILSFVGGLMLGVAVLHLLPQGMQLTGSQEVSMTAMLVGLLVTFFMMRFFRFHQHEEESHDHEHHREKSPHHARDAHSASPHARPPGHVTRPKKLSWMGVAFGLGVHTLMDGVALGAAILSDANHPQRPWSPGGLSVYLAILLHKPLDALSMASLMRVEGWSWRSIQAVNAGVALMCPVGGLCVMAGLANHEPILGQLLAAAAGVFLCISLSDLLPEVQFHRHDRLQLSMSLLLGIAVAWGMERFHQH